MFTSVFKFLLEIWHSLIKFCVILKENKILILILSNFVEEGTFLLPLFNLKKVLLCFFGNATLLTKLN